MASRFGWLGITTVAFILGLLGGHFGTKPQVVTKVVTQTVEKVVEKVVTQQVDHTIVVTKTVKQPNGAVETTVTENRNVDTGTKTQTTVASKTGVKASQTVETPQSRYSIGGGALLSIRSPIAGYYGEVGYRVIGPLSAEIGFDTVSKMPHIGARLDF